MNRGSAVTPYLEFSTPICLFTIQLSWGYDDDQGSLHSSIAIVKAFQADFWSIIWLGHVTCKQGVAGDPIFDFPDPDLPIYYTVFMGLR